MANTDINIQGKFVSVTSEGIIAGSEQVNYTANASGNKAGTVAKALDEHADAIGQAGVLNFATVADMAAVTSSNNGHIAYCADTKRHYYIDSTVTPSVTQGYWLELEDASVTIPKHIWDTMTSAERQAARTSAKYLRIARVADDEPFTIEPADPSQTLDVSIIAVGYGDSGFSPALEISTDDGATWTDFTLSTATYGEYLPYVTGGVRVKLRAKSKNTTLYQDSTHRLYFYDRVSSSVNWKASGNIMSLLYRDFADEFYMPSPYALSNLFNGCTHLTTAPSMPATGLTEGCYASMFYGCTSLSAAPLLPATVPATACYSYMFQGCTSLASIDVWLHDAVEDSMRNMFYGCTSLTEVTLRIVDAMYPYSCGSMFNGCTSLTSADLRTLTDANGDDNLSSMFRYCTSLAEVWAGFMLWPEATAGSSNNRPTENWLDQVAANGTFHLPTGADISAMTRSEHNIPADWTVEYF